MNYAKQYERLAKLNRVFVSTHARLIDLQQTPDQLAARRMRKRTIMSLIINRKMYARTLEDLFRDLSHQRKLGGRADRLTSIAELRRSNGRWLIDTGILLEYSKLRFSEKELQTTLSIPSWKLNKRLWQRRKSDMPALVSACRMGDPALASQLEDAAIYEVMNNEKTLQQFRWMADKLLTFTVQ